jgi:hypothetical protein
MPVPPPNQFHYRDKQLGDTTAVILATAPDVFSPVSTTVFLWRAARRVLGTLSGSGTRVCASDRSAAAVRLARHDAARNGVAIDCQRGGLFEPWTGECFDLIVDDVAGVAERLARLSGSYPRPCRVTPDGTRLIPAVLDQTPEHLAPRGGSSSRC